MKWVLRRRSIRFMLVSSLVPCLGLLAGVTLIVVVVAGMFLTVPFEIGFGRETLAQKFLCMAPRDGQGEGKSLSALTELVKKMTRWEDAVGGQNGEENGDEAMNVDG